MKLAKMDSCCYSGDLVDELPIGTLNTLPASREQFSGLIQGEINPPFIKYCINRKNWEAAKELLNLFLNQENVQEFTCDNFETETHK